MSELECGQVPNVMAALPNIGGALCSMSASATQGRHNERHFLMMTVWVGTDRQLHEAVQSF